MKRLRSVGLLLLFVALYSVVLAFIVAATGATGLLGSSTAMLVLAVALGWLLLVFVERRPMAELGLAWTTRTPRELGFGFLLPCAALLLAVGLLLLSGALRYQADDGTFVGWLLGCAQLLFMLAVPAAAEEAMFRGYPFQKLVEAGGPWVATLLASGGFALVHRHNPGVGTFALINIFLAGVMLSMAYLRTRSLWLPMALHLGWNWQIAGPLDLPISGLELFDAPLYEPRMPGPVWLNGGGFGPEGGVVGLIALALITTAVWLMTRAREPVHD